MKALSNLQVHETSIDQAGLDQLAELQSLRDICLYVADDNFSFEALLELSARMPQCAILAKGRGEFRGGEFDSEWDHSAELVELETRLPSL